MPDQITVTVTTPSTDAGRFEIYESSTLSSTGSLITGGPYTLAQMTGGTINVDIADNTRLITVKSLYDRGLGCGYTSASMRIPLICIQQDTIYYPITSVQIYSDAGNYYVNGNLPPNGSIDPYYCHPSMSADYSQNGYLRIGVEVITRNDFGSTSSWWIKAIDTDNEYFCTKSLNIAAGGTMALHVMTKIIKLSSDNGLQPFLWIKTTSGGEPTFCV